MAEFNNRKNVSEIPAGEQLPGGYKRQESIEVTPFPNFQAAITNYADSTNWMSFVGSNVASAASNALATKIGGELGKNPQGEIGIPITDFDKTMQQSYKTQAHATLTLQANKLITDSALEAAKQPKITPETIKSTNQNIISGLQNILKNSPDEIKPNLESQFGNAVIETNAFLTNRMIKEQKQDMVNNASLAFDTLTQQLYSIGLSRDSKESVPELDYIKKLAKSEVANNRLSPENAKIRIDSARQTYLSGKIIKEYNESTDKEAFLRSIADKKPSYLSDADYMGVTNNLMQYVNHQNALRAQDQTLRLAKFQTSVAMNPMAPDMASQLQDLKNNVLPDAYEKAQLHYINAVKVYNAEQAGLNSAYAGWKNPGLFAQLSDKIINKAFENQVSQYVQKSQNERNPISVDEAEVQVAAAAGGRIPVFEKTLENKLMSGNPASITSAAEQIEMLNKMEQGRVYSHIPVKAKAIATLFMQQRGSMPDTDLARKITDNLSNIDETMQKTLDNSWNQILTNSGAAGIGATKSFADFALQEVGLNSRKNQMLGGDYFGTIYGNDIYNQLNSNFIATRGDYTAAKKMTQDYVDTHYGDTYVNGFKQKTDSPIERYLGYKGNDITPFVQKDLLNQLSVSFAKAKKNHPSDYWETLPLKNGVAEVSRHIMTKEGMKEYRYPVELVGHAGNQWDVVVKTPYAQHNIFLVAPHLGVTTYTPNKEAIEKDFKANKPKGWF